MKLLTFDNLFDKNIHINKYNNLKKFDNSLYKIFKNSCIIDLTYTSVCLYKLYKIFYMLNSKNVYISFIHYFKWNCSEYVNLLLKFTDNNIFNTRHWVNGTITNEGTLDNILALGLWLNKIFSNNKTEVKVPMYIYKLKKKVEYVCSNLKFRHFSKFIFMFNVNKEKCSLKECLSANKFVMGICDHDFDVKVLDFFVYSNNINEMSINFIAKFILCACINSKFYKVVS